LMHEALLLRIILCSLNLIDACNHSRQVQCILSPLQSWLSIHLWASTSSLNHGIDFSTTIIQRNVLLRSANW
jgi:hypothetical protein